MPQSTGYILHTPLQSWSRAGKGHRISLLADDIKHAIVKGACYIIIDNVAGLKKSPAIKIALDNLNEVGYKSIVMDITNKSIIVGKK